MKAVETNVAGMPEDALEETVAIIRYARYTSVGFPMSAFEDPVWPLSTLCYVLHFRITAEVEWS